MLLPLIYTFLLLCISIFNNILVYTIIINLQPYNIYANSSSIGIYLTLQVSLYSLSIIGSIDCILNLYYDISSTLYHFQYIILVHYANAASSLLRYNLWHCHYNLQYDVFEQVLSSLWVPLLNYNITVSNHE